MDNRVNDNDLNNVSGGAGKTRRGYNIDDMGNVTFVDTHGDSMQISKANWDWLLTQYKGPIEDPEYYLSTVPVNELKTFLSNNNR